MSTQPSIEATHLESDSASIFQEDGHAESSVDSHTDSSYSFETRKSRGKRKTPTVSRKTVPPSKKAKLTQEGDGQLGLLQLFKADEDLETTTFLKSNNYFIHSRRYIFCAVEGCRRFLTVEEATTHLTSKHCFGKGKNQVKDKLIKTLSKLTKVLDLLEDKPSILNYLEPDHNLRRPLRHIEVKKGFKCPSCVLCFTTLKSLKFHASDIHNQPGSSLGAPIEAYFQSIWIQHKDAGLSTSIRVNPDIENGSTQEALPPQHIELPWFTNPSVAKPFQLHERQEAGYFKTIGYTQRVEGIPTESITESFKKIKDSQLRKHLTMLCVQYLAEAQKEIETIQMKQPRFLEIFKCPSL